MTGVLDACKQHRQTPKVFDDYREMLDSIKPALYALRAVDKWLEIKACQSELIAKSLIPTAKVFSLNRLISRLTKLLKGKRITAA